MRIKLTLLDSFETSFNDKEYVIYQFVDNQSLTILTYSTTDKSLAFEVGKSYECQIGIKKSKLYVVEVL